MASASIPARMPAPQPGLRSWIVYGHIPDGCIAIRVADRSAEPHLHRGDFVIVDTADREPQHGETFAICWESGRQSMQIVEAVRRVVNVWNFELQRSLPEVCWSAEFMHSMMALTDGGTDTMRWSEGPYPPHEFKKRLWGKVVGIYELENKFAIGEVS